MNSRSIIGVHMEHGVIQRITAEGEAVAVVIDDGRPTRAMSTVEDDGGTADAVPEALESTRCHGIGIACDIASERLARLSREHFDDSRVYVEEIAKLLDGLREMVVRSIRLDASIEAA